MIRIRDISLLPGQGEQQLLQKAAKMLHLTMAEISSMHIRKRSVDARKKNDVRVIYTVDVTVSPKRNPYHMPKDPKLSTAPEEYYRLPRPRVQPGRRPVIVGFGPAGMFSALVLARCGWKPIVIERGDRVDIRTQKVEAFWNGGALDPESNVQFGEGGAGTFSDGKLNTGVNNIRIAWVLDQLASAGADESIRYDAKPHIGTDALRRVVGNIREQILSLGGEIRFRTRLTGIETANGAISSITVETEGRTEIIPCERLILAIGHSARDTFQMLLESGVPMEPKAFSMGVRIEHPQKLIDKAQYGDMAGHPHLPPADYKLSVHLPDGDSAYTFCMCPGGYVVAAASEEGGVVTNGMSNRARNGENANSAVLVTLKPEDFPDASVLGGMHWQREIEQAAFRAGGGTYAAPAQTVGSFLGADAAPSIAASYRPGVEFCDLHDVLPQKITNVLEKALPELGKRLRGFDDPGAVMTAPETRSSSPVRILRGENKQSVVAGLFPCGEGAGYAGGITSAAVDGILCAEALMDSYE